MDLNGKCDALRTGALIIGGVLWVPSYIYALVQAPRYGRKHNQKIREEHNQVTPWVSFRNDEERTKSFGLAFSF